MSIADSAVTDRNLAIARHLRLMRPRTPDQLHAYVQSVLGFSMPRDPIVPGHAAPFDYLLHAFFEDQSSLVHRTEYDNRSASNSDGANTTGGGRDCIVWANRGGGKTQIAAIATLLDLVFKPGIQVRILGGSFEQSTKMYRYLKKMLTLDAFRDLIAGNFTGRYVELANGSRVEVLSQSECAVRGQRVHKVRCDEVDLFDPDIWDAVQLATRSGQCGDVFVPAAIEALSTMHKPFGLMQRLVQEANATNRRVFRWSVMDTIEHCPNWRSCGTADDRCPLWETCGGRAKHEDVRGYLKIDDAIQQRERIGPHTWNAEMLCEQPSRDDCVYPEFNPKLHVFDSIDSLHAPQHVAGIDFGLRDPTVMLWAVIDERGVVNVIDELIEFNCITEKFIALAEQRTARLGLGLGLGAARAAATAADAARVITGYGENPNNGRPAWVGADPAGHQRSEQTGVSTITMWRRAGWKMRTRHLRLEAGVEAVRRRFLRADGSIGLRIHRRCTKLIEAVSQYHYPTDQPESCVPVKDGPDHACDALRYLVVNIDREVGDLKRRRY